MTTENPDLEERTQDSYRNLDARPSSWGKRALQTVAALGLGALTWFGTPQQVEGQERDKKEVAGYTTQGDVIKWGDVFKIIHELGIKEARKEERVVPFISTYEDEGFEDILDNEIKPFFRFLPLNSDYSSSIRWEGDFERFKNHKKFPLFLRYIAKAMDIIDGEYSEECEPLSEAELVEPRYEVGCDDSIVDVGDYLVLMQQQRIPEKEFQDESDAWSEWDLEKIKSFTFKEPYVDTLDSRPIVVLPFYESLDYFPDGQIGSQKALEAESVYRRAVDLTREVLRRERPELLVEFNGRELYEEFMEFNDKADIWDKDEEPLVETP